MKLLNKTLGITVSNNLRIADTFFSRLLGLIPKKELTGDECLLITRCSGIHTFFMRFPIDAVFMNRDFKVLEIITNLKPYRFSPFYPDSYYVCEFKNNFVNAKIRIGDFLEILKD